MDKLVFYCKTYIKDYKNVLKLIDSYNAHNKENIKLYISCPEQDYDIFSKLGKKNIIVVKDEEISKNNLISYSKTGLSIGYINQQICKLCFAEYGVCDNYLCLDSDVLFIRDFYYNDFMYNDNVPYSVLIMDKDLQCEKAYQKFWDQRYEYHKKIYQFFGLDMKPYKTCHAMQILNVSVMKELKQFLNQREMNYADALEIAPFEFTWYNTALQYFKPFEIIEIEPLFKFFHNRNQYITARKNNISVEDWARAYVGIVLNSNWNLCGKGYKNPSWIIKIKYVFDKIISKSITLIHYYMKG